MDQHSWQAIVALAGLVNLMGGGIIRYLLKELKESRDALKELNKANADLAKMVPALLEEAKGASKR